MRDPTISVCAVARSAAHGFSAMLAAEPKIPKPFERGCRARVGWRSRIVRCRTDELPELAYARLRDRCEALWRSAPRRACRISFHMSDYDLVEARFTISAMQTDLDRATAHVNELQATVEALNARLVLGDEQIENLTLDLSLERLREEIADAAETRY
jgi:hypothetical protein